MCLLCNKNGLAWFLYGLHLARELLRTYARFPLIRSGVSSNKKSYGSPYFSLVKTEGESYLVGRGNSALARLHKGNF